MTSENTGANLVWHTAAAGAATALLGPAGLLGYGLFAFLTRDKPRPSPLPLPPLKRRNAGPFGDAGWATWQEIINIPDAGKRPWIPLGRYIENYGMYAHEPGRITDERLGYSGEANLVTLGPVGTGKTASGLIPYLLQSDANILVLDIKCQLYPVTRRYRSGLGHKLIVIDPWNETGLPAERRACINPLASLVVKDGKFPPHWVSDLKDLCEALVLADNSRDPHWNDKARAFAVCIAGHLCTTPGETPTLARLRQLMCQPEEELILMMRTVLAKSPIPVVRDNAGTFCTPTKETASIISNATKHFDFLDDPELAGFLETTTFDWDEFRRAPCTGYIVISPQNLSNYPRFVRLLVQSFMNAMHAAPIPDQQPVTLVLDEQARLGHMRVLEDGVATMRDYKVRLWSVFQDINQIKSIYAERWETFLSNAGVLHVLGVNDVQTADYLVRRIGNETVAVTTTNVGAGSSQGFSEHGNNAGVSENSGTSTTLHGIPFLSPQDLYGMAPDEGLLLYRGLRYPVRLGKVMYFDDQRLKGRWDQDRFHAASAPAPAGRPKQRVIRTFRSYYQACAALILPGALAGLLGGCTVVYQRPPPPVAWSAPRPADPYVPPPPPYRPPVVTPSPAPTPAPAPVAAPPPSVPAPESSWWSGWFGQSPGQAAAPPPSRKAPAPADDDCWGWWRLCHFYNKES